MKTNGLRGIIFKSILLILLCLYFLLVFSRPNEHEGYNAIGFTGSFYYTTDDVEALWERLKDKVRICYGIETFFYGMREFGIYAALVE